MAVDRSKYTATKVSTLKSQEKEVKNKIYNNHGEFSDWLKIEVGQNKLRIYPAHKGTDSFIWPRCTIWLERNAKFERDGKQVEEIQRKPVFNSRIHGNTKKDLVEEYINFATKTLLEEIEVEQDENANKLLVEKLGRLTHWQTGLKYKTGWCMYANKYVNGQKQFGQIEVTGSIKERMNELSAVEDVDDPIQLDPFTDIEEGKALIVTKTVEKKKQKNGKLKDETKYSAAIESRGDYALTDKEIEEFEKIKPLQKIYQNSFKLSDFELQIEGLKLFDEKEKLGIFEYDQFLEIAEEIKSYYPEPGNENNEEEGEEDDDVASGEEDDDAFDNMNREELKKWILVNCKNKEIRILTKDTEETLRQKIKDFLAIQEQNEAEEEDEETEEAEETEELQAEDDDFENNDLPWDKNGKNKQQQTGVKKQAIKKPVIKKPASVSDAVKKKLGL